MKQKYEIIFNDEIKELKTFTIINLDDEKIKKINSNIGENDIKLCDVARKIKVDLLNNRINNDNKACLNVRINALILGLGFKNDYKEYGRDEYIELTIHTTKMLKENKEIDEFLNAHNNLETISDNKVLVVHPNGKYWQFKIGEYGYLKNMDFDDSYKIKNIKMYAVYQEQEQKIIIHVDLKTEIIIL